MFGAVAVHLHGSADSETKVAKLFSDFLHEFGLDDFKGVPVDHIVFVENTIKQNIFTNDVDIEDGEFVDEPARRSIEMCETIINLLRYNNHNCYIDDINTIFKQLICPNCVTFP